MNRANNDFIDVEESIRLKNPKLLKILPAFVIKYIRKTIHEDYLNDIIARYRDKKGLEFAHIMVHDEFKINLSVKGFENVSKQGRYIFVANHPWGGLEAAALLDIVGTKFPEPRFVVNDILMSIKNYHPLFIPVNKHGVQGKENARILNENFASDKPMLIFPAGLVSRRKGGKVQDLEWKKFFVAKATQYKRDIVPIFIDARNSNFFYNLSNFRQFLGIKANIEMFYLADELVKQTGSNLPFYFGKPISYQTLDKSRSPKEWARLIKNHVYLLKENYKRDFI